MKIDKVLTIVGVFLILVSGALWFRAALRLGDRLRPVDLLKQRQARTAPRVSSDLNQRAMTHPIANASAPEPPPASTAPTPKVPDKNAKESEPNLLQICEAGWQFMAQRSGADLQDDLSRGRLLLPLSCLQKMKSEVKISGIQSFVTFCQLQLQRQNSNFVDRNCIPWLPQFRAYVIRNLQSDNTDLASLDNTDLANQLIGGFVDSKNTSAKEVERNIQIANTLIEKDPNYYPAYKAKLLSLLTQELKFGKTPTMETYEDLYDDLLSFRSDHPDLNASAQPELAGMDPDLIHIPFLRLSAKNDVQGLSEMARDYIAAYPNSHVGYMYLAEAAWKSGNQDQALQIMKSTLGETTTDDLSRETLLRVQSQPATERIMEMKAY